MSRGRSPRATSQRSISRQRRACLIGAIAFGATRAGLAQRAYPERPITLIVPFAPGGIADLTARVVAQAMSVSLGQTMIVENRPSAGAIVATTAVATARPDGYTLLLLSNGNAVSASLFKKLPFDVVRDFAPIGTLGFFDLALFVDQGSRFTGLRELIAYAKAQPGKLNIGTIALGSTQHLSAELFKTRAGIDAVIVPYKGTPALTTALRAGEIDLAFEILGPMLPQLATRALRALAVTGDRRYPELPEVPTIQQAGVAGYSVSSWNALAAPATTPSAIVQRLNAAANAAVETQSVRQRFNTLGVRPQGGSPGQLQALLVTEIARWREVIVNARIETQ